MKDLTRGKEWKGILEFTIPMFVGSLFQQLYNVVDSVVVGKFAGKEALAAVGGSFPIILLISSLMMGVTMGTSILIAQYYGAKDRENVKKSIQSGYIILIAGTILMSSIGLIFSKDILIAMKVPSEIMKDSVNYLNIMFLGLIGSFGYNTVSGMLRGLGDSKTSVYFLILSTLLNVVLDILFVVYFKMGVVGVAWATLIAQFVSFVSSLIYLYSHNEIFRFNLLKTPISRENLIISLKLGLPTGVQQICLSLGIMAMQSMVNGFGSNTMAAFAAASKLDTFATLPMNNFSLALSTFVAQNIGANKMNRIKKGLITTLIMVNVTCISITIVMWLFGKELVSIFTNDQEVITYGIDYLKIVGSGYMILGSMFSIVGFIRGTGHTLFPTFVTLTSLWVIRIPTAVVMTKMVGINGLWIGIPIGWLFGLLLAVIYYYSGKWKEGTIIKTDKLQHSAV
ncbi:MAG: conserved rane protein of unknown function [Clostridia bacterium]|jgi:putative MATE family efflux protein|nr:conserved rane protein of unknown function [Clostridia bacterium]